MISRQSTFTCIGVDFLGHFSGVISHDTSSNVSLTVRLAPALQVPPADLTILAKKNYDVRRRARPRISGRVRVCSGPRNRYGT
jgi:hypothetical protein